MRGPLPDVSSEAPVIAPNATHSRLTTPNEIGRRLARRARFVGRLARSIPVMAGAAVARSGTDYSVDVMTRVGHETYGRLESLGQEAAAATEWRVVATRVDPPRVAFESPGGRIEVALEPVSSPGYLQTAEFSLVYRGVSRLEPEHVALLERLASALRGVETDPKWLKAIRRPLLRRVSYFPADSRIEFRPNLACNHACPFCNSVDRTGADNVAGGADDLLAEMALWRSLPVSFVVISGGEPTLVKRLPELVESFADEGFGIELQTNGMAFDDPAYAERMAAAGVRRLLVSLHSADADRSDSEITFFPGGWKRTVEGIDNALDAGIKVAISHVLHGANALELGDFMRFVSARWGRRVTVRSPTARCRPRNPGRRSSACTTIPTASRSRRSPRWRGPPAPR